MRTAVVVPSWNGRRWLPGLVASIEAQERAPDTVLFVDNGSRDGSAAWLREHGLDVLELGRNTGFSFAANRGIERVEADAVALVNTDVELAPDWLARAVARLEADPALASVATKMVLLDRPDVLDDCGDVLRRDGVAEQRGQGWPDDGRWDEPGEVFGACAGAAVFRRDAVLAVGGFDERLFAYLEDVDLALRLRLAGWRCGYEPAVARHARHGSDDGSGRSIDVLVARNTLVVVVKAFPLRWLPLIAYRQLSWFVAAARERRLRAHLGALISAAPLLAAALRERRSLRAHARVPVAEAVPPRPWRGRRAGGHPEAGF